MAMFDIKDSEAVNLNNNITTDKEFLKGENIKQLTASGNQAGEKAKKIIRKSRFALLKDFLLNPIFATIIATFLIALIAYFFPQLKSLLKYD